MNREQYLRNLELPKGAFDVVLDTDAYNEVDDQYAIALMLKSPERFNLKAIYAAPFFNGKSVSAKDGMEKSYNEILNLLSLMGRSDFSQVYKGSDSFMSDEKVAISSPAVDHLISLALTYSPEKPLYVVALGAITNIASALIKEPKIAENIVIVWLGGHATYYKDTLEFNMREDFAAARVVFKSASPLVQLPCMGVTDRLATTKHELAFYLKDKGPLNDYLYNHTVEEAESYAFGKPWSRIIWDISAVLYFLIEEGKGIDSIIVPAPMPEYSGQYSYSENNKLIKIITYISRDLSFEILFNTLLNK